MRWPTDLLLLMEENNCAFIVISSSSSSSWSVVQKLHHNYKICPNELTYNAAIVLNKEQVAAELGI